MSYLIAIGGHVEGTGKTSLAYGLRGVEPFVRELRKNTL